MKIYLLIRSLTIGGTERQLINLASGLVKQGIDTKILVFYGGGNLYQSALASGLDVVDLRKKGRWDIVFFTRLIQIVRTDSPGLFYGFLTESNLCALLLKVFRPNLKITWGIRAVAVDREIRSGDFFVAFVFKIAKVLSKYADVIVANSEVSRKQHIKEGFYSRQFKVVPNGVKLEEFFFDPELGLKQREKWGITPDCLLIGIVARLDPVKNHSGFLKAAALLLTEIPESRFVCIGDGPKDYKDQLLNLAHDLDLEKSLIWVGDASDLRAAYNALDLCTLCSFTESAPNALLESMACQTLSVVSDVGGIRAIAGDNAIYSDPCDERSIKDAWISAINKDPESCKEIKRKGRQIVVDNYSEDQMVSDTAELLRSVISKASQ